MTAGIVSTSINAGDITATGHGNPTSGHQLSMGNNLFIHITPETAKQWIGVLEPIAKEDK